MYFLRGLFTNKKKKNWKYYFITQLKLRFPYNVVVVIISFFMFFSFVFFSSSWSCCWCKWKWNYAFQKEIIALSRFFFSFSFNKNHLRFSYFFSAFLSLLWWPMSVYGHIFFFRKVFEKPLLLYEIEIITKDNLKIIIMQFFFHHFLFQIINNKRNYKL